MTAFPMIAVAIVCLLNELDISANDVTQLKFLIGIIVVLQYLPIDQYYEKTKKYLETIVWSQQSQSMQDNPRTGDD